MELMKVNKHVMEDAHGTLYYRNSKGNWKPGAYDGKKFVWKSTTKYAARKRTFDMPDGTTKVVRLTKYTYERFLKPAYAPISKTGRQYKHAYLECYRALYWDGMELYKAIDYQMPDDTWINSLEPFYAYDQMWDRWPEVERDITTMSADELDIQPATEQTEDTDIVAAAEKIIEEEAARLSWIESTTTEGQQIDMFAYFGYGNNEWQELAYAGGR